MILLSRFKVSGHSMIPTLKPGQEILVSSIPYFFKKPRIDDIIAFKGGNKFLIKRIKQVENDRFLVKGDNKTDSKEYGWIERGQIIGKVIYFLKS